MKRSALVVLILVLLLPASAFAGRNGGYVSGFLGVNMADDESIDSSWFGQRYTDDLEYDPGVFVGGAIGGDLGLVRLEGEISYRYSDIDQVTPQGGPASSHVDGSLGVFAVMANMFIDLTVNAPITPYIGGGVGFASLSIDDVEVDGILFYEGDDDGVFAYQLGAGIAFDLSRNAALDLGYRFFGTEEADFVNSSLKYESHTVMLGLRYTY